MIRGTSSRVAGAVAVGDEVGRNSGGDSLAADGKDVGRLRWFIWSILAFCYFVVFFHRVAPGVVADRLMADFSAGGATVGMLAAIYFYVYAAMQIPSGALADTLGIRRTVAMAAMLSGLGSLLFALAPALEPAYLGRFLVGLGVSVVFVSAMKFQANWFRAGEFGFICGLMLVVGNLGAVVATTPMALATQALGWRLPFVVVGVAGCAAALAAWRWVRDHPPELSSLRARGVDAARGRDGTTARPSPMRQPLRAGVRAVWRNRQTWSAFLAHFGILGAYLTFAGLWAVPYLMHVYGMDRPEAANHVLVASLGMVVSAPFAGAISDRLLRRRLPILILGALACGFWLTLTFWNGGRPPVWALYPLFAALGLSAGIVPLLLAVAKESSPPSLSGLAIGTVNNPFLCAALLQPALGYLLDSLWQGTVLAGARVYPAAAYQVALAVLTGFVLMGFLAACQIRETHCSNQMEE